MIITLTNQYHETRVNLKPTLVRGNLALSRRQVARAKHTLCNDSSCHKCQESFIRACGIQEFGPYRLAIREQSDGSALIDFYSGEQYAD